MTDWADAVAEALQAECGQHDDIALGAIAKALRQAKAAGMREAADEIDRVAPYLASHHTAMLRAQADEIEKIEEGCA